MCIQNPLLINNVNHYDLIIRHHLIGIKFFEDKVQKQNGFRHKINNIISIEGRICEVSQQINNCLIFFGCSKLGTWNQYIEN